jgi:hypothetical protein
MGKEKSSQTSDSYVQRELEEPVRKIVDGKLSDVAKVASDPCPNRFVPRPALILVNAAYSG